MEAGKEGEKNLGVGGKMSKELDEVLDGIIVSN